MLCETLTAILIYHVMVTNMHVTYEIHGVQAAESRLLCCLQFSDVSKPSSAAEDSQCCLATFKREHCQLWWKC